MSVTPLHFKVIYRNGAPTEIADFYRDQSGKFIFDYRDNPAYEFPGFVTSEKRFESESLWEQISIRIPNLIRDQNPDKALEELLILTGGKLVTDHFEFDYVSKSEPSSVIDANITHHI